MSDVVAELVPAAPTGLMAWLRFDASRVPEVEAAYENYIRVCQPGVFAALALPAGAVAAFLVAIVVYVFAAGAQTRQIAVVSATIAGTIVIYVLLVIPILYCPPETRKTILLGCADIRRTIIFALLGAFAIACLELVTLGLLGAARVPLPKSLPNLFFGGMLFGVVLATVIAPVGEELLVQGWFQTRMLRFGVAGSAIIATGFFVLLHLPRNPYDFVRGGNLAFSAYLRATTRSLLACIVAHACNNAFFIAIVLLTRFFAHNPVVQH